MRNIALQRTLRTILAVVACALLLVGAVHSHKVYDDDEMAREFGMFTFQKISELQLTVDATFSGTVRKEGKLFSAYDRSAPRGKKACPT